MFRMIFMIFFLLCFGIRSNIYMFYIYIYIYFPYTVTLIQIVKLNKNGDKTLFEEITVE